MSDSTFVFVSFLILVSIAITAYAAYRNGVRDGYQNNWLPHVKKQIKDENLEQWSIEDWSDDE